MVRCADGLLHFTGLTSCLTELLDVAAHRYAGREAVVEAGGGPRLTYAQLWTSASRIAGGMLERGVGIGDRVAIRMPNGVRWVQAFLGVLLAGGVPVPVHPGLTDAQLRRILADSGSLLVLDSELPTGTPFIDDGAALGDSALLFYTSGTTGQPKGVELSHENVLSTIEAVIRSWGGPESVAPDGMWHAVALPLSSATVCVSQLLPTLASGGTVVLAPEFDAHSLRHAFDVEGIERLSAPTYLCRQALRTSGAAFGSLRVLTLDDEIVSPALMEQLCDRFPAAQIVSGWGMTETGGAGMILPMTAVTRRTELPHSGMEFAVKGSADDASVGELWCRGPSVMRGYWGNPEGTARTTARGWLRTGDVARIGHGGGFRIVGRVTDAIEVSRGVVYSREVEDSLLECPGVDEAVAVDVMTAGGRDLAVIVVPKAGADLELDAVREFLDAVLGHRLPRRLCAKIDVLPRSSMGRIDRRSVRAWFEDRSTTKGCADVG
ncbi:long-chain fatty acid--CoA ligase [Rhodococcus xishaensis]|uniref:Long-chain fatty acid--CoA ligase n=2 Tax=Rhodococcus xishaensis TaxID=2487364 RepID=A0A438AWN7_9NOCA|nr:long-chain fatty acid--CoA ligase [Rhodococcus xishaensis]